MSGSTFSFNHGGGVAGMLIMGDKTATAGNSTFYYNITSGQGGGIYSSTSLHLTNTTLSGNSAESGGANLYNAQDLILKNNILADPAGENCGGLPISNGGGNLRWPASDTSCVGTFGAPISVHFRITAAQLIRWRSWLGVWPLMRGWIRFARPRR